MANFKCKQCGRTHEGTPETPLMCGGCGGDQFDLICEYTIELKEIKKTVCALYPRTPNGCTCRPEDCETRYFALKRKQPKPTEEEVRHQLFSIG